MRYPLGSLWRSRRNRPAGPGQREYGARAGAGGLSPTSARSAACSATQRTSTRLDTSSAGATRRAAATTRSYGRRGRHGRPRHVGRRASEARGHQQRGAGGRLRGRCIVATRRFLWTAAGGMIDLGTWARSSPGLPFPVRTTSTMPGRSSARAARRAASHAFLWTASGGMVDLGTLGGSEQQARAINDAGQVVGRSDTASGDEHAFLWTAAGGMVDLGTLGGSVQRRARYQRGWAGGRPGRHGERRRACVPVDGGGRHGRPRHARRRGLEEPGGGHQRRRTGGRSLQRQRRPSVLLDGGRRDGRAPHADRHRERGQGDQQRRADGRLRRHRDRRRSRRRLDNATNPPTPEEQIESLETSVQELVASGSLKPGQANGLTRPLQNALRSLARGHLASACSQLSDFQVEVTQKVLDGALTPGEGVALIDAATSIRTALGC